MCISSNFDFPSHRCEKQDFSSYQKNTWPNSHNTRPNNFCLRIGKERQCIAVAESKENYPVLEPCTCCTQAQLPLYALLAPHPRFYYSKRLLTRHLRCRQQQVELPSDKPVM
jgi:hypothetical protein